MFCFVCFFCFLVLTSRICFRFIDFQIFHIHKKWRQPFLSQLFSKAAHTSTVVEPNQMKLGFVLTNDKASCVAKEDCIYSFRVAKKAALNKQWIKSCVLLSEFTWIYLNLPEFTWINLKLPEITWNYLKLPEITWIFLNLPEFPLIYLTLPEFTWIFQNLPKFTWIYLNLPKFT